MSSVEPISTERTLGGNGIEGSQTKIAMMKQEKRIRKDCAVSQTLGDEAKTGTENTSPKNRRKIRQPKQYIPQKSEEPIATREDTQGQLGSYEAILEHSGIHESTQGTVVSPESPSSESGAANVENNHDNFIVHENHVHVLTASQDNGQGGAKHTAKRGYGSQKAKRAANRPGPRKTRASNLPAPKKPEDLIRESLASGKPSVQATKRDAQYRKSYAYKIWKEKANCEVTSDGADPNTGTKQYPNVHPGQQHNQGGGGYYWPPAQFNGGNNTGFYANGKYYEINPSVLQGEHNVPQVPPNVPQTAAPSTVPSAIHTSTPGVVTAGQDATIPPPAGPYSRGVPNPGGETTIAKGRTLRNKTGPSNAVVCTPRLVKSLENHVTPPSSDNASSSPAVTNNSYPQSSSASPGHETPSPVPQPSDTAQNDPGPRQETAQPAQPAETPEQKPFAGVASTTSPTNLACLMKTTLKRRHAKENVQPLSTALNSNLKMKRKLEGDDSEPSAKKNAKQTIFTPLNEQEAEKLANDIYDVNLEYFPFQTLAEKAAQCKEVAAKTGDEKVETGSKVGEIERVRCLLKDFYDVTYSCSEDPDMQKFDSASRKFGRKNILNHLSLLDRYFAELQKKVVESN